MNYYDFINKVKENYSVEWLTPSQQAVFQMISQVYKFHEIINVYGHVGVGKTFLSWVIEKELSGFYIDNISEMEDSGLLIIDNCSNRRKNIREIIQESMLYEIDNIIIITDKKANDDIFSIELSLTDEDKTCFKNNLWRQFNLNFEHESPECNLHNLIKSNIQ